VRLELQFGQRVADVKRMLADFFPNLAKGVCCDLSFQGRDLSESTVLRAKKIQLDLKAPSEPCEFLPSSLPPEPKAHHYSVDPQSVGEILDPWVQECQVASRLPRAAERVVVDGAPGQQWWSAPGRRRVVQHESRQAVHRRPCEAERAVKGEDGDPRGPRSSRPGEWACDQAVQQPLQRIGERARPYRDCGAEESAPPVCLASADFSSVASSRVAQENMGGVLPSRSDQSPVSTQPLCPWEQPPSPSCCMTPADPTSVHFDQDSSATGSHEVPLRVARGHAPTSSGQGVCEFGMATPHASLSCRSEGCKTWDLDWSALPLPAVTSHNLATQDDDEDGARSGATTGRGGGCLTWELDWASVVAPPVEEFAEVPRESQSSHHRDVVQSGRLTGRSVTFALSS